MNILRIICGFGLLIILGQEAKSQEMLGATLGNYAGITSIQLNPSAMHNSKMYLDVQLLGMDVFLQNNYLYMKKSDYRFSNFFKAGYEWPTHNEEYGTESRIFYHYTNTRDKNAFIQTRINGPGAMLIWGDHAFGISTSVRTVSSLTQIPFEMANFAYLGLNYKPQHNINYADNGPIRGAAMSWAELGLSYSNTFYARGFNVLSAGITVKRLFGFGGMYVHVNQIDYTVPNDSTIDVKNFDGELGISLPVDYNTNAAMTSPLVKGGGFGFDAGITYTRLKRYHQCSYFNTLCAQLYEDYLYRVGLALIDIGGINFKTNASKQVIDNRSAYWENVTKMDFRNIHQFLDTLSYKFYGDTTSAWAGDHFTMWLPAALSAQFDYHINENWYVNASLIYGFPIARATVVRPAQLSVTPRYETRWFEVSMPVSMYNWQLARIGMAVRFYGLTIGTDKLGGFFHTNDFTGLDFYFSFKIFFNKGNCRIKGPVHCGTLETKKIKY